MSNCCICHRETAQTDAPVLFIGENGDNKELCENCAAKIGSIYLGGSGTKAAVGFLREKYGMITDNEVKDYIQELIDDVTKADVIEEKRLAEKNLAEAYLPTTKIWITAAKIIAWVMFGLMIISGIVICGTVNESMDDGVGFVVFLIFFASAFLSVVSIMVFLGMAENLEEIKQILSKKKK